MQEFKTEHRISEIMKALNMSGDDARQVYYAFDKLLVFKKQLPNSYIAKIGCPTVSIVKGIRNISPKHGGLTNSCVPRALQEIFSEM